MQTYLVVGTPISHSLSPRLHNAVYQQLGLDRQLTAHDPKDTTGFEQLIAQLRAGKYQGLCVTIPYKLQALQSCDNLTPTAQRTGAVNYIRREADGSLMGDNTDSGGFAEAVKRELNFKFTDCRAVVCGSGGASRAIVDALLQNSAAHITLVSRNPQPHPCHSERSAQRAVEESFSQPATQAQIQTVDYDTLYNLKTPADLLVNTTPLGMNDDLMPVSADWLRATTPAVYDAVYRKEGTTPLVQVARKADLPAADGRSMLIEQAILGMRFWGVEENSATLRSIIDSSLV